MCVYIYVCVYLYVYIYVYIYIYICVCVCVYLSGSWQPLTVFSVIDALNQLLERSPYFRTQGHVDGLAGSKNITHCRGLLRAYTRSLPRLNIVGGERKY